MEVPFSAEQQESVLSRGFSRRQLGRIAAVVTAGASLPFYNEFALAQRSSPRRRRGYPADAVRISSNENPLGPCPDALEALYAVAKSGGRYSPGNERGDFVEAAAAVEGVKPEYIAPYAGSSDPLHRSVCAFVSPSKGLVAADPGYEAAARTAEFIGAPVKRVPLRKDYAHDVKAMLEADPNAGVYYICNPNNPSGTLTPREDIEYVVANLPKDAILLLDEAYIHFSDATPGTDLVAQDKNVIVLRTFSKAYGMAGLRAGMAIGRPDLIEKLRPWGSGMLPITGLAAGTASLKSKTLVPERRKINKTIREETLAFLDKRGYQFVPSQSNKFMLEVGRPGGEVRDLMAKQGVFIGRTWPAWPNWVRVTVGTEHDMSRFREEIVKILG